MACLQQLLDGRAVEIRDRETHTDGVSARVVLGAPRRRDAFVTETPFEALEGQGRLVARTIRIRQIYVGAVTARPQRRPHAAAVTHADVGLGAVVDARLAKVCARPPY